MTWSRTRLRTYLSPKTLSRTRPQFDNSSVIIAGDWNVVQDYRVDTLNYTGENNLKSKLKINQMINNMDLVGVWIEKHPDIRRYTWRGPDKKQWT